MNQHQEAVLTIAVYLALLGSIGFVSLVGWAIFKVKKMIQKTDKLLEYVQTIEKSRDKESFTID